MTRRTRASRISSVARQQLVAGPVKVLPLAADLPFAEYRFTPRQLRAEIAGLGWKRVAGFQTRNPIHRAHEHLTKLALEVSDGLVIHPLVGETKQDDVPAAVRFKAVRGAGREVLPEGPHRAGGFSGGDALRGAARGDLPRHRAQELRHQPADRRPRSRRRRQVLRAARGAADLRSVRAGRPWRHAAPARSDVLLPRLRHARLVEELPARRELAPRALGIEGARDPASGWPSARGVHAARSGGGAARRVHRGQRRAPR